MWSLTRARQLRLFSGELACAELITFSFPTNSISTFDYNAGIAGNGSLIMAGTMANSATSSGQISDSPGPRRVTIPIDATFHFTALSQNDTTVRLVGQIVATEAPLPAARPRFSNIDVVENQILLTVESAAASARLQASANGVDWSDKEASVTTIDADTRLFTAIGGGAIEFYQIIQ